MRLKAIGLIAGYALSFYFTYYSPVADKSLVLWNAIHIHHWMWALCVAVLFFLSLKLKRDRLFFNLAIEILLLISLVHSLNNRPVPGLLFLAAGLIILVLDSVLNLAVPDTDWADIFVVFLICLTLGIAAEGITTAFLNQDWHTFHIFFVNK